MMKGLRTEMLSVILCGLCWLNVSEMIHRQPPLTKHTNHSFSKPLTQRHAGTSWDQIKRPTVVMPLEKFPITVSYPKA